MAEKVFSDTPSEQRQVSFEVNGEPSTISVDCRITLAEALRENLGLTGTKVGCNRAECGACTVIMDGKAVFSCTTLAVEAEGKSIQTIEGLGTEDDLDVLQRIFIDEDALQCGYCVPGVIMSVKALLNRNQEELTTKDIRAAIAGNYCRCGIFPNVEHALASYLRSK